MNGSENSYAGAIFFALMSLGAFLKLDDTNGLIVGAVGALLAAISLRRALIKSAQAAEEDLQRIEIQFQQLRNKITETAESTATAMESVNVAAQLVRENILHDAGATSPRALAEDEIIKIIRDAGRIPTAYGAFNML